eukprot:m.6388 g.6388  ORF g.6388 m.6388 type:complete len:545 (+) comp3526_c0_seq1:208-1842(+)
MVPIVSTILGCIFCSISLVAADKNASSYFAVDDNDNDETGKVTDYKYVIYAVVSSAVVVILFVLLRDFLYHSACRHIHQRKASVTLGQPESPSENISKVKLARKSSKEDEVYAKLNRQGQELAPPNSAWNRSPTYASIHQNGRPKGFKAILAGLRKKESPLGNVDKKPPAALRSPLSPLSPTSPLYASLDPNSPLSPEVTSPQPGDIRYISHEQMNEDGTSMPLHRQPTYASPVKARKLDIWKHLMPQDDSNSKLEQVRSSEISIDMSCSDLDEDFQERCQSASNQEVYKVAHSPKAQPTKDNKTATLPDMLVAESELDVNNEEEPSYMLQSAQVTGRPRRNSVQEELTYKMATLPRPKKSIKLASNENQDKFKVTIDEFLSLAATQVLPQEPVTQNMTTDERMRILDLLVTEGANIEISFDLLKRETDRKQSLAESDTTVDVETEKARRMTNRLPDPEEENPYGLVGEYLKTSMVQKRERCSMLLEEESSTGSGIYECHQKTKERPENRLAISEGSTASQRSWRPSLISEKSDTNNTTSSQDS